MNTSNNPVNPSFQLNCQEIAIFKSIEDGSFFHRSGLVVRERYMKRDQPKTFLPHISFPKKKLYLSEITSWFCSALRGVLKNFIQIIRISIIDKFKCYNIYALMQPFIDKQPVNRLKLFVGYVLYTRWIYG